MAAACLRAYRLLAFWSNTLRRRSFWQDHAANAAILLAYPHALESDLRLAAGGVDLSVTHEHGRLSRRPLLDNRAVLRVRILHDVEFRGERGRGQSNQHGRSHEQFPHLSSPSTSIGENECAKDVVPGCFCFAGRIANGCIMSRCDIMTAMRHNPYPAVAAVYRTA